MRIKIKNPGDWNKHFVIFPRKIDGHYVFLETVERRTHGYADLFGWLHYEYRLIK